jgi:hypothetical protein
VSLCVFFIAQHDQSVDEPFHHNVFGHWGAASDVMIPAPQEFTGIIAGDQ